MMRILIFLLGAMLGAACVLFIVLMQWNAPEKLGWSISWLPMATPQDATAGGSIRAIPPVAAPVSDSYPEPQLIDIVAEPTPMPWPPFPPPVATWPTPRPAHGGRRRRSWPTAPSVRPWPMCRQSFGQTWQIPIRHPAAGLGPQPSALSRNSVRQVK